MVTIVVLLILTGITVNMTVGDNGLLTMAKNIKENIEKAEDEGQKQVDAVKNSEYLEDGAVAKNDSVAPTINSIDVIKLSDTSFRVKVNATEIGSGIAKVEYSIDGGKSYVTPNYVKDTSYVFSNLEGNFEKYNIKVKVTDASGNTSDSSQQYQMITEKLIPSGFYYVGGSKYSGVVISDNSNDKEKYYGKDVVGTDLQGNQFVWVPVATIADYKRTVYSTNISTEETDTATNSIKINYSSSSSSYFIEALPEDEKTSVTTYKGFYIGRYEAGDKDSTEESTPALRKENSSTGNKISIKAGQAPYNYVTRTQAQSLAEGFKTQQNYSSTIKTKLVSSYAWDTTIAFIQKVNSNYGNSLKEGNYYNTTFSYTDITGASQTKASGSSVLVPTGQTTPVCNIYDMGGNVWEYTTEFCSNAEYPATKRGGKYEFDIDDDADSPAGYRNNGSGNAYETIGFRIALFM